MRQFFLILFLLTGLPLFSENSPQTVLPPPSTKEEVPLPPPPPIEDYGAAFFKMIMMLLGILVLVILTVWVIKRYGHGRLGRFKDRQSIHILERKVLSPKSVLYLIEIDGAQLLVAESQLEVRPLHQWQVPSEEEG